MTWVGIPFRDGGRTVEGCDCWGLVRLFLAEECRADVPTYGEAPSSELALTEAAVIEATAPGGLWREVDRADAQRGDVAVMLGVETVGGRLRRTRRHVGVMVDSRRVLHVEEGTDSVIVPLSSPSIVHRVDSLWRHRDL